VSELIPIRTFIRTQLDGSPVVHETHCEQFERAGYIPIHANYMKWGEIHGWLSKNHPNRYSWTGNIFWFDDSQIAVKFALRFA